MPTPTLKTPFEYDRYYHIYNRGNNKDILFYLDKNYEFFLRKYKFYLSDHVSTYAYCLNPNHFHLLIKTRSEDVSGQLRKFFQSYALSINKQEDRTGSLFRKNFRRILIEDDVYLKWLVFYIHFNPEKHKIIHDYRNYSYSSYNNYQSDSAGIICRNEVFEWFGDQVSFFEFHSYHHEEKRFEDKGYQL